MNDLRTEYDNIVELEESSKKQIERLSDQKEGQLRELLNMAVSDNQVKAKEHIEKLRKQAEPKKRELLNKMYKEAEKTSDRMRDLNQEFQTIETVMQKVKAYEKYLVSRAQKIEAERCVEQWNSHKPVMDIYGSHFVRESRSTSGSGHKICSICKTILPLDSLDHSYLNRRVKEDYEAYEALPIPDSF